MILEQLHQISEEIKDRLQTNQSMIIFVDGRGGSGKSTMVKNLAEIIDNSLIINLDAYMLDSMDMFSRDNIEREFEINFENRRPDIEKIRKVIEESNAQVIFLEGCFSFKIIEIIPDVRIWIEVNEQEAKKRLNDREKNEHTDIDPQIIELSTEKWQDAEERYLNDFKPKEKSDFILLN